MSQQRERDERIEGGGGERERGEKMRERGEGNVWRGTPSRILYASKEEYESRIPAPRTSLGERLQSAGIRTTWLSPLRTAAPARLLTLGTAARSRDRC